MYSIAVLMTVHNRREKTILSLSYLYAQTVISKGVKVKVYLVDDGSTDGTAEAIKMAFPETIIIHGNGKLFWGGGMRLAYDEAIQHPFDYLLWLNDDTLIFPDALKAMLQTSRLVGENNIIVGSLQDPETSEITYGGLVRSSVWHPLHCKAVEPGKSPRQVLTMNGNCVLIPMKVAMQVGNIDPSFTHVKGDLDYAYRADKMGIGIWICPGYVGHCKRNPLKGTWQDKSLPLNERWKKINSSKGIPPHEWRLFTQRHGGPLWPVFWIFPYLKFLLGK